MTQDRHSFRTRSIHVGNEVDPATGAVIPRCILPPPFANPVQACGAPSTIRAAATQRVPLCKQLSLRLKAALAHWLSAPAWQRFIV